MGEEEKLILRGGERDMRKGREKATTEKDEYERGVDTERRFGERGEDR